ncbi:MAG: hypothetical protein ACOH15_04330 [Acetobacterium sp.]
MEEKVNDSNFGKAWFVLLFFFIFPPVGIIFLLINEKFDRTIKVILTILFVLYSLFFICLFADYHRDRE